MSTPWTELILVHNDAGVVYDEADRRRFLEELKASGTMSEAFLTRTWLKHENPKDRRTWGPVRRDIDWTGFDPEPPEMERAEPAEQAEAVGGTAAAGSSTPLPPP